MRKLIKKLVDKYIVKILIIFNQGREKVLFSENKNYLSDTVYYATVHLIRLLEEMKKDEQRRDSRI